MPIQFTPPPPAPSRSRPATFSAEADAFLAWMQVFGQEINNALSLFETTGYAVYSGSPNGIVLTAGYPTGSIGVGTRVRFRATASNTGGTSINLDGHGARQCRTITGAVLPAGYIRNDVETEATFNGTYWILDRQEEQIDTPVADGGSDRTLRYANGRMRHEGRMNGHEDGPTISVGDLYRSSIKPWVFPIPFTVSANRWLVPNVDSNFHARWTTASGLAADQMLVTEWSPTHSVTPSQYRMSCEGYWY